MKMQAIEPVVPPKKDDPTLPQRRPGRWDNQMFNRGRGPGSTASGRPRSAPPEKRPPIGNIVLF